MWNPSSQGKFSIEDALLVPVSNIIKEHLKHLISKITDHKICANSTLKNCVHLYLKPNVLLLAQEYMRKSDKISVSYAVSSISMQNGNYLLTFDGLLSIVHSKEYPTTELQEFMILFYDEIDKCCIGVYGLEKESAMMSYTQGSSISKTLGLN